MTNPFSNHSNSSKPGRYSQMPNPWVSRQRSRQQQQKLTPQRVRLSDRCHVQAQEQHEEAAESEEPSPERLAKQRQQ
jgi:hypothetical protein